MSPVDGVLSEFGAVVRGRVLQVKGMDYSLTALLGSDARAAQYEGGLYFTIYLSPSHYHRIHAPLSGTLRRAEHRPGTLFPVNTLAVRGVEGLFPRNERVDCDLESEGLRATLVAVGALCVGRISTAFDSEWNGRGSRGVSNRGSRAPSVREYDPPAAVRAGEELMTFHLGSTVVLLVEGDSRVPLASLRVGQEMKLGQALVSAGDPCRDRMAFGPTG